MDKDFQNEINELVTQIDENLSNIGSLTANLSEEIEYNEYLNRVQGA